MHTCFKFVQVDEKRLDGYHQFVFPPNKVKSLLLDRRGRTCLRSLLHVFNFGECEQDSAFRLRRDFVLLVSYRVAAQLIVKIKEPCV